ncbi:MAG: hypothetical protein SFU83_17390 [Meiothermus sp.]|nr:hypothetical protein [Meiothermus sp.]
MRLQMLPPAKVAQVLIVVSIVGLIYFFFIARDTFGSTLTVCTLLGAAAVQYPDKKPFVVPLFAGMIAVVILMQSVQGEIGAALLGTGVGLVLPFIAHRIQLVRQRSES